MKSFKVSIPIYDRTLYIYLLDDIKEEYKNSRAFRREAKKLNVDVSGCEAFAAKDPYLVIGFDLTCLTEEIISHEVFHTTSNIMNEAGSKLTDSSEEAWAYLNGWLNAEIRKKLTEKDIIY